MDIATCLCRQLLFPSKSLCHRFAVFFQPWAFHTLVIWRSGAEGFKTQYIEHRI